MILKLVLKGMLFLKRDNFIKTLLLYYLIKQEVKMANSTQPIQAQPATSQTVAKPATQTQQTAQQPVAGQQEQPKKKKSLWWLWLIIVIVVIGAGVGAYFLFLK